MIDSNSIWYATDRVYERFNDERFPGVTEKQIAELEDKINVTFPDLYREFILRYNGGYFSEPLILDDPDFNRPQSWLESLSGINAIHGFAELGSEASIAVFDDNDPVQLVPIGNTMRNYLILLVVDPTEDDYGHIALKTFDQTYLLADNIVEFFDLIAEKRR